MFGAGTVRIYRERVSGLLIGVRVTVTVPPVNGPSHESAPVYAPVIRSLEGTDAATAIVTEHIGVGAALLPDGNDRFKEMSVPETVPVKVPTLFL